jgi:hypothetical protein
MGSDTIQLDYPLPDFASARTENGVTQLRVRTLFAPWFKRSVWAIPVVIIGMPAVLAMVAIAVRQPGAEAPWWLIAVGVSGGVVVFASAIFGATFLIAAQMTGEIVFDGKTVVIKDRGIYEIPLDRIRAIRHVVSARRRVDIDPTGPPSTFLRRLPRRWMEVQVPEGRIRFFGFWGEREIRWLSSNARRLCLSIDEPNDARAQLTAQEERADDVVMPGRMYGTPRRLLVALGLTVAATIVCISSWYVHLGVSSNHWPRVQGRVEHSLLEDAHDDHGRTIHAELRYSYQVFGATYRSEELGFGRDNVDDIVKRTITQHPEGSAITVYYDPNRPAESVVIPGVGWILWFALGIGCLLGLTVAPLALRRTTAAQDRLAPLYHRWPKARREDQFQELAATLRWTTPAEPFAQGVRIMRRQYLLMAARTMLLCGLAVWAAYHLFARLCPPDFPWGKTLAIIAGMATLPWAPMVAYLYLKNFKPGSYAIGPSGVSVPSRDHPLTRWERIASFTVQPDDHLPQYRVVTLHRRDGSSRSITLPLGATGDEIVAILKGRLPESAPPARATPATLHDWIVGLIVVAITTIVGGELLLRLVPRLHHNDVIQWVQLAVMLAGPGTWMAIAMRKHRAKPTLLPLAAAMNLFSSMGIIVYALLREALRVS